MALGNQSGARGQFDEFVDPSGKSITSEVATASQVSSSGGLSDGALVSAADSPFTASAGTHYPVDTSGGAITVNLPGTPTDRDRVELTLITAGNTLTVDGNGLNIEGSATVTENTQYTTKMFQYFSSTNEWVTTT